MGKSWEQHRYAVERAAALRKGMAERAAEEQGGVSLQGEANGSDAEMLEEVAEFLKALEGYDDRNGGIGFLKGAEYRDAFVAEWNKCIATVSVFAAKFGMRPPEMLFHPAWLDRMNYLTPQRIQSVLIYAGVKVRFGEIQQADVIKGL